MRFDKDTRGCRVGGEARGRGSDLGHFKLLVKVLGRWKREPREVDAQMLEAILYTKRIPSVII
jgi:hypothetical protein